MEKTTKKGHFWPKICSKIYSSQQWLRNMGLNIPYFVGPLCRYKKVPFLKKMHFFALFLTVTIQEPELDWYILSVEQFIILTPYRWYKKWKKINKRNIVENEPRSYDTSTSLSCNFGRVLVLRWKMIVFYILI